MLFRCNILINIIGTDFVSFNSNFYTILCVRFWVFVEYLTENISAFRHDLINIVLKFIIIVVFSDERCGVFAEET